MKLRILVVEDEPGLALTVSDLLTIEGYEVETAPDGEAVSPKRWAATSIFLFSM